MGLELETDIRFHEKAIERLSDDVFKLCRVLKNRSRTLYRLVFLKMLYLNLNPDEPYNPEEFKPKRGKRSSGVPIREVMTILEVSHRTAQDYARTLKALDLLDEWFEHQTDIDSTLLLLRGKR